MKNYIKLFFVWWNLDKLHALYLISVIHIFIKFFVIFLSSINSRNYSGTYSHMETHNSDTYTCIYI